MIRVNELRIGNVIVSDAGVVRKVTGHDIREQWRHEEDPHGSTGASINPIPLTPEWLERCGFVIKHEASEQDPFTYSILKMDLDLAKEDDGYCLRFECQDSYYDCNIGTQLLYLHQLQNLFFALSGEELNVKL